MIMMNEHPPIAPVLFVSHGAPTFALEPGKLGGDLLKLGRAISVSPTTTLSTPPPSSTCNNNSNTNNDNNNNTTLRIRAILVISAHWQTSKPSCPTIMTHSAPSTVYDFGGFDDALYQMQYPAIGPSPALVARTAECLSQAGWVVEYDNERGFDHGVWVPLLHIFPQANIPVYQVSMPRDLSPARAIELGLALAPLRREGVFIVGSGGTTHNLLEGIRNPSDAPASPKAVEFARWVRKCILANDSHSLVNYKSLAPHAEWAHPSLEHYLPLLVAVGASSKLNGKVQVMEGGITYGVLAMDAYLWDGPEL